MPLQFRTRLLFRTRSKNGLAKTEWFLILKSLKGHIFHENTAFLILKLFYPLHFNRKMEPERESLSLLKRMVRCGSLVHILIQDFLLPIIASKMATKGRQAAAGLGMRVNTTRPRHVQKNEDGRDIRNGVEGRCRKLDKSQNVALRAILPVWKMTLVKILQREAATPPIHNSMDYLCGLAGIRMERLESKNPL